MSTYTPPPPPPPPAPPVAPPPASDDIHPTNPPKDAMLAMVLNIIGTIVGFLGIGYLYIGQWQKALVAMFGFWVLIGVTAFLMTVCVGFFLIPVCIAFAVATVIDVQQQTTLLAAGRTLGQWTMFNKHK